MTVNPKMTGISQFHNSMTATLNIAVIIIRKPNGMSPFKYFRYFILWFDFNLLSISLFREGTSHYEGVMTGSDTPILRNEER
jgi:hypothetical protein